METEEGSLPCVIDQVMLEANGNFERCVAFRADLVLSVPLVVGQVAEAVEHDLVSPAKLSVTLATGNLSIRWSSIPINS